MRELTVFVYLAGDSNLMGLADKARDLFNSIRSLECPECCALIVEWDRLSPLSSECGATSFSASGEQKRLESLGMTNSALPETLSRFLLNGISMYPARRTVLILTGHSDGFLGLCCDDTDSDEMTVSSLASVLKEFAERTGKTMDVVVFDSCWMAMIEVVHELSGYCSVMMASQDEVLYDGIPVREMLIDLFNVAERGDAEACEMACSMLRTIASSPPCEGGGIHRCVTPQFSALLPFRSLAMKDDFACLCEEISLLEHCDCREICRIQSILWHSGNYAVKSEPYLYFCDLRHFCQCIIDSEHLPFSLKRAASELASRLEELVVGTTRQGALTSMSRGLSFFFPAPSYADDEVMACYSALKWSRESGWLDLLNMFRKGCA
ncbi:MAG: clostripain-related cysteine peptidase [Candidatus Xenobiia bacterium LiM19]